MCMAAFVFPLQVSAADAGTVQKEGWYIEKENGQALNPIKKVGSVLELTPSTSSISLRFYSNNTYQNARDKCFSSCNLVASVAKESAGRAYYAKITPTANGDATISVDTGEMRLLRVHVTGFSASVDLNERGKYSGVQGGNLDSNNEPFTSVTLPEKYSLSTVAYNEIFFENYIGVKIPSAAPEFEFTTQVWKLDQMDFDTWLKTYAMPYITICDQNSRPVASYSDGTLSVKKTEKLNENGRMYRITVAVKPGILHGGKQYSLKFDSEYAHVNEGQIYIDALGKDIVCYFATEDEHPIESVKLNKNSLSLKPGTEEKLTVSLTPADADVKDVLWKSSDSSVASVTQDGTVKALKAGTAVITAECGGVSDSCLTAVTDVSAENVTLDRETADLDINQELTLKASVLPENASIKDVIWSSSNGEVASVDQNGKVRGLKAGTANIIATAKDGGFTAVCKVTVKPVQVAAPAAKAASSGYSSISLSWSKVPDAEGYKIYRKTAGSSKYLPLAETDAGTVSYSDTKLTTGVTYQYNIKAYKTVNGVKYYSPDNIVSAKPALGKVSGAEAKAVTYSKVRLTWKTVTGAHGYEIYKATSKSGTYSLAKRVSDKENDSAEIAGLATGKTCYYKVRAYRNTDGDRVRGAFSEVKSATPRLKTPALKLTAGKGKVTAKWTAVSGRTAYNVYTKSSKSASWKKAAVTKNTGRVLKVKKGRTCYVRVNAYRTVNGKKVYSSYSKTLSAKAK